MNPRDGGYDNLSMNNSARYAPNVHYETELRRPGEDRSSTPTVSTFLPFFLQQLISIICKISNLFVACR